MVTLIEMPQSGAANRVSHVRRSHKGRRVRIWKQRLDGMQDSREPRARARKKGKGDAMRDDVCSDGTVRYGTVQYAGRR